mmetsp:Transcript_31262/g.28426  ORF Transcript_31262/g.28426 Transcript_31262/m.28426 type:complete len:109 (+) Transcript_31262:705-1031(+)
MIAHMVNKYGLQWVKIAEKMEVDDPMKIRNRYYSHIKKRNLFGQLLKEVKLYFDEDEESEILKPKQAISSSNPEYDVEHATTLQSQKEIFQSSAQPRLDGEDDLFFEF